MKALPLLTIIPLLGFLSRGGTSVHGGEIYASNTGPGTNLPQMERLARGDAPPHDLHVSYGNLGVEGSVAVLQIRIFKDDLEEALRRLVGAEVFRMEVSPEVDAVFLRYLSLRFVLEVGGDTLRGTVLGSGEDELDREPVWWYQVQFGASAAISSARVTNTVLFEVFDDQRNVLRVVRFPEESRQAFYFAPGEESVEVRFERG